MAEKIKLTRAQILKDMKGDPTATPPVPGLDRKGLKAKYGLSHTDMAALIKAAGIKNLKVKKEPGFILVDEDGDANVADGTVEGSTNGATVAAPQVEEAAPATSLDKW